MISYFRYPNVIILTTSNVTGAIDLAFVDRADIKQYIGPLPPNAIYKIYQSGINELTRVSLIKELTGGRSPCFSPLYLNLEFLNDLFVSCFC